MSTQQHPPITMQILRDLRSAFFDVRDHLDKRGAVHGYEHADAPTHINRIQVFVDGSMHDVRAGRLKVKHIETGSYWVLDWHQEDTFAHTSAVIFPETVRMTEIEPSGKRSFLGERKFNYKHGRYAPVYPLREDTDA